MKSEKCLPDEIASRFTLHAPRFTLLASRINLNSRKDNKKNP